MVASAPDPKTGGYAWPGGNYGSTSPGFTPRGPTALCDCRMAPIPHPYTVACAGEDPKSVHSDSQYTSSFEGGPVVVPGDAMKTDQYPGDRQRLVGDITTKGARDVAKGTRGNSKQVSGGSTKGRPGGPVSQSQRAPYDRRSTTPQGPGGHPSPSATERAENVRSRGQQRKG